MDEINNLDASPGVLDYFWNLDKKITVQEKKIRRQRNRIELLDSDALASKIAKSLKALVDNLQAKIDKMEAKHNCSPFGHRSRGARITKNNRSGVEGKIGRELEK